MTRQRLFIGYKKVGDELHKNRPNGGSIKAVSLNLILRIDYIHIRNA